MQVTTTDRNNIQLCSTDVEAQKFAVNYHTPDPNIDRITGFEEPQRGCFAGVGRVEQRKY